MPEFDADNFSEPYVTPTFPSEPFMLQPVDIDGMSGPIGPYRAEDFYTDPETGLTRSTEEGGSNLYLRTMGQSGNTLYTHDGEGNDNTWMMIPIPDNSMPGDGEDAGSLLDAQRAIMSTIKEAQT